MVGIPRLELGLSFTSFRCLKATLYQFCYIPEIVELTEGLEPPRGVKTYSFTKAVLSPLRHVSNNNECTLSIKYTIYYAHK